MIEIKEMPYHEKYDGILSLIELVEDFAPKFVNKEMGKEKVNELLNKWENESEEIPRNASFKDKYDIAHRNFLQNWISALNFIADQRNVSTDKYMQVAIEAWVRKYARTALGLKIFQSISSREAAFQALAKRLAYQLQVFSPFTVSELNENRMILTVTPCKIRGVRGCDDFCNAACKNIIPSWLQKQFNVKMNHKREGNNCTVTFEPF